MKRTEGISWQYPKNPNDSIQNLLEGLFFVECGLTRLPSAKGVSKQYLEHIKFLIERALKYKSSNSNYVKIEKIKYENRENRENRNRNRNNSPKSVTFYENCGWAPISRGNPF